MKRLHTCQKGKIDQSVLLRQHKSVHKKFKFWMFFPGSTLGVAVLTHPIMTPCHFGSQDVN